MTTFTFIWFYYYSIDFIKRHYIEIAFCEFLDLEYGLTPISITSTVAQILTMTRKVTLINKRDLHVQFHTSGSQYFECFVWIQKGVNHVHFQRQSNLHFLEIE